MKRGESQPSVFITGYGIIVKLCELKTPTKNKLLGLDMQQERRPYPGEEVTNPKSATPGRNSAQ